MKLNSFKANSDQHDIQDLVTTPSSSETREPPEMFQELEMGL